MESLQIEPVGKDHLSKDHFILASKGGQFQTDLTVQHIIGLCHRARGSRFFERQYSWVIYCIKQTDFDIQSFNTAYQ